MPFICAACGALNLYHLGRDKTRHIPDEDLPAFLAKTPTVHAAAIMREIQKVRLMIRRRTGAVRN